MKDPIIFVEHLYKRYSGGEWIFENASFSVSSGDFLFLLGSSGSGKTTLIKIISGQESFDGGTVLVAGKNLRKLYPSRIHTWRRHIGIVFQDFRLLMDLTVEDNISLPLIIMGFSKEEIKVRVMAVLRLVNLEEKRRVRCRFLSGGERQLVSIGRAIVHSPILILADEPTGNLDDEHAKRVLKLFSAFHRRGQTLIVATHDRRLPLWVEGAKVLMIHEKDLVEIGPTKTGESRL
ncbi:MAG: ATP-binding cassette domain-containing protein [Syntrophobacterales bacterium]|nr:ATP-binding cassette domain-containing protein [Syntrophobacterales bacterium]